MKLCFYQKVTERRECSYLTSTVVDFDCVDGILSPIVGYDMSTFIRRYGRYLNEKAFAYRQMAFDFTKVKKGYVSHPIVATL